jgi:hypothetical protein
VYFFPVEEIDENELGAARRAFSESGINNFNRA